jgi:hypothetical protein
VTVLRAIWVVAGGVAGGLAAAERAVAAATELGRGSRAPDEVADPEVAQRLRASFPSQRSSASMLDPYIEFAGKRARPSSR